MQISKKVALRYHFILFSLIVIITLIPFGRGNISGLDQVSFPFYFLLFFLLVKK